MITRLVLALALGLLVATAAVAGIDLLPPRTVIDQFTCADLAVLDETGRERAMIYLAGVADGRRGARTFDPEAVASVVDRVLTACPSTPSRGVLEALVKAWR